MTHYAVKIAVLHSGGGWEQSLCDVPSSTDALALFERALLPEAPAPALVELIADGQAVLFGSSFIPRCQYGSLVDDGVAC